MDTMTDTTPRAWVGCLACYNDGRLVGEWVDGTEAGEMTTEDLHASQGVTIDPRYGSHEELWVMDHENYGPLLRGECSPSEAQEKAELLSEVDDLDAFLAYADLVGPDYATVDGFEEAYAGEWDDEEDFARDLLDSMGEVQGDSLAERYFDYAAFARDLFMGDYSSVRDSAGSLYVFRCL